MATTKTPAAKTSKAAKAAKAPKAPKASTTKAPAARATRPAAKRTAPPTPFKKLEAFDEVRAIRCHGEQLAEMRVRSQAWRKWFKEQGEIRAVRTHNITMFPFPVAYGLYQVPTLPYPWFTMRHRMNLVQFRQDGKLKTLLMNATDPDRSSQTPYFRKWRERMGERASQFVMEKFIKFPLQIVREAGLRPEDIDYVTHDHLHTQDLRGILGTVAAPGGDPVVEPEFPNAQVIVQRAEIESLSNLHPLQKPWFVADALRNIRTEKLLVIDGDYLLGEGAALLHTPGHTWGNHTLVLNTDRGVYGISENGVCPDAYTPECSRIPGVRRYLERTGWEVVMNGNTLEGSMEQYTSMVQEKNVVDFNDENPNFVNMYQSSPLEHSALNPGIRPTFTIAPLNTGQMEIPAG